MSTGTSSEETTAADTAAPATAGSPDGDPTALGLPCFIAGSASFGLAQAGVVPGVTGGAALPVILGFAAIGIFITTIWAASLGRNAVASVFGIFAGFWLSYGMLLLGVAHDWFGITPASAKAAQELYLVVWLIVIVTLTVTTLRMPLVYTAVFILVDLALLLVFLGVNEVSDGLSKAGGYVALVFAALGVYLYASTAAVATGGRALPLGRPLLR
jgi:succinate-acetate transporter protein